jgi:hypothetical protein
MKTKISILFLHVLLVLIYSCGQQEISKETFNNSYVKISSENPSYFELTNGDTYIPVGPNLCWASDMETMESYIRKLAANGGNFIRIWLNHPMFETETEFGKVNETAFRKIDRVLEAAEKNNIKVKMCIESFRRIEPEKSFFSKTQYHISQGGPFKNMPEYIHSEEGRQAFLNRLEHFRRRYGSHPVIFGWELWNEMNAIDSDGLWKWNEYMLPKVHAMFPNNLVMQSLGSFDHEGTRNDYRYINRMSSNDVAQIHRYLDLGAQLDICKAPMDVLSADAIDELRSYHIEKPMLLAEVGGVKPKHTGPIELYAVDKDGSLLHDLLFAPFFAGAAGPGHAWHWDHYIDENDLWYHFGRFNEALKSIDPVQEKFIPVKIYHSQLRIYGLVGNKSLLLWCRDINNTWQNEFERGIEPELMKALQVDAGSLVSPDIIRKVSFYDPWKDVWTEGERNPVITLPEFKRSLVVRIEK